MDLGLYLRPDDLDVNGNRIDPAVAGLYNMAMAPETITEIVFDPTQAGSTTSARPRLSKQGHSAATGYTFTSHTRSYCFIQRVSFIKRGTTPNDLSFYRHHGMSDRLVQRIGYFSDKCC